MIDKFLDLFSKLNKKIKVILWIICLILFLFFYNRMEKNKLSVINYNKGNNAFRQQEYEWAESRYEDSLYFSPTKRRECKVRINYALSIVTPITPESVTWDNLEESILRLEEAKNILTEHDCAHEHDTNGHNKKAQTLKNEIDDYIEWLKQNVQPPEDSTEKEIDDDNQQSEDNEEQSMSQEEIEKALMEEQREQELRNQMEQDAQLGQEERFSEFEYYSNWDSGISMFDGKNW